MAPKQHTHKYRIRNIGSEEKPRLVYACSFSDCTHFQPSMSMVIGKKSICWACDQEFNISAVQVNKKVIKPRCRNCRSKDTRGKSIGLVPELVPETQKDDKLGEAIDILANLKL